MLQISGRFSAMIVEREGPVARGWVERLPGTMADLLERWELRQDGLPRYGMCAVVLPVRRKNGVAGALKVGWIDEETRAEPLALRAWAGRGAADLVCEDAASGAMLLERLDPQRALVDVPIEQALDAAAAVLRDLRVPAIAGRRSASDIASRWSTEFPDEWQRLGGPCDESLLSAAVELCAELSVPPAEPPKVPGTSP